MIEELIARLTAGRIVFGVVVFLFVWWQVDCLIEDRKVRRLGKHAPLRRGKLPLSIDILFEGIMKGAKHKDLEFFYSMKKYGNPKDPWTIELRPGGRRVIVTQDPENIKAVLATQFGDYGKGQRFNELLHEFLGDSIFSTDGKLWHNSRQLLRPQFIKDRVSDLEIFERHTQALMPLLGGQGQTVDVFELFMKYTLDAATDFLLGESVDSLNSNSNEFARAFGEVQRVAAVLARSGSFHKLVGKRSYHAALDTIDRFIQPFIDRVVALTPGELEKSEERYNFLHALAGYTKNRNVLRDQLYAVLLAGRDTTACTLSWTFYELSKAPNVVAKLRQEIIDHVGLERCPTYADLKNMRYLQHIMNEVLRLYPVVPFNIREALQDCTLPRGGGPNGDEPIGVPKRTPIGYSPLVMQRREDLYPPRASGFPPVEDFVPERWDVWTPKPWQYIPFNGGPRICLGQQFALTEMGYTIARIIQKYPVIESRMSEFPGFGTDIVLLPLNGAKVAFWSSTDEK